MDVDQVFYVPCGLTVNGVNEPVQEGYKFLGWYKDRSYTERFIISQPNTSNMEIYPKFEVQTINLWFDCGESGPIVTTQKIPYGETGEYPDIPEYYGHEFIGWYKDYLFKDVFDFSTPITEDTTVYGKFDTIYVTVNFMDEEGNEIYQSKSLPYGTILSKPKDPEKEGTTFSHWTSSGSKYTFTEKLEGDITLVAVFTDIQCIITYELNGGTSSEKSQVVTYGSLADEPEMPEKEGNSFVAWCTTKALNELFNFNVPIKENITIYAKWKTDTFNVTYIVDGEEYTSRSVEWGHMAPSNISTPTKENYNFIGWYDVDDKLYDFSKKITEDVFIYAKFNKQQVGVIFNTTGGSVINPVIVNVYEPVNEPAQPTREGYSFEGWYKDTSFTTEFDFDSLITVPIVIYAKWEILTYEVNINTNDNDGTTYDYTVNHGDVIKRPETPSLSGYSFECWKTSDGKVYDFGTPVTSDLVIDAHYVEYSSETGDDLLTMINSGNYYKAEDIGFAIERFIESYVADNDIDGWKTDDLRQLFNKSASIRSSFRGDKYYLIEYERPNFIYTEKQITYSIPLTADQIAMMIPLLLNQSSTATQYDKNAFANYLIGCQKEITDGNYEPI